MQLPVAPVAHPYTTVYPTTRCAPEVSCGTLGQSPSATFKEADKKRMVFKSVEERERFVGNLEKAAAGGDGGDGDGGDGGDGGGGEAKKPDTPGRARRRKESVFR